MSRGSEPVGCGGRGGDDGIASSGRVHRFLRLGHLLSSVLQEILDQELQQPSDHRPLSRSQFCLLKLISLNAGLQVGEVARRLGVSAAATSKHLDRLERVGLVRRSPVPGDRRGIAITVSHDGRELVRAYERLKRRRVAPVLERLDDDQHEHLCRLLEKVCLGLLGSEGDGREVCLRCAGYFQPDCAIGGRFGRCGFEAGEAAPAAEHPLGGVT